jgi:hypothetical protein
MARTSFLPYAPCAPYALAVRRSTRHEAERRFELEYTVVSAAEALEQAPAAAVQVEVDGDNLVLSASAPRRSRS